MAWTMEVSGLVGSYQWNGEAVQILPVTPLMTRTVH